MKRLSSFRAFTLSIWAAERVEGKRFTTIVQQRLWSKIGADGRCCIATLSVICTKTHLEDRIGWLREHCVAQLLRARPRVTILQPKRSSQSEPLIITPNGNYFSSARRFTLPYVSNARYKPHSAVKFIERLSELPVDRIVNW